ncbi:MAG: FAD-dependent oxidoreductase, partial [Armatimonadota bacterium]
AVRNPQRSASVWDLLLYEWVRREPNIALLLNTSCIGVQMESENRISAVIALRNSTEDVFTVRGKIFIDCSGDGRLGVEAGAEFRKGREGRDEFGESLAPPKPDNKTLGSSILFITRRHDRPIPFKPPDWIRKFPRCEDLPHRAHSNWEYGFWWVEWGGELDTIKDNERIRDELLAIALGVWDHIKNSGLHPESENWALEWIGFLPGKRESRRFVGDYILTQHDLQRGEVFEDGVAYGGWPIDLHPPEGIDTKEPPNIAVKVPLYNIPFRSLYSRNIDNLLFAGRNISATHVAFGSTRVMGTCSVMGQAVGTAAALCIHHNCIPRELGKEAVKELQQLLLKQDAYIIGVSNSDPYDIARTATVRASSEVRGYEAVNVINGVHRGVYASKNRWASDPTQPMPQWLELHFREPRRIREVHLTFDTGLNRELTLSFSDWANRRMIWGPQPETVRDYELQVLYGESAKTIAKVEGNYQRKRVHQFEPQLATGVRLIVHATNGDKSARVFEVRVYE